MSKEIWEDFFGVKEEVVRRPHRRNSTGELVRIDLEQVWKAAERDRRLLQILYRLNHIEDKGKKERETEDDMLPIQRNGSARNLLKPTSNMSVKQYKARRSSCPDLQDYHMDFQI
uniref:Uncharacterized protein n=1 Tax=Hanusia phi TaxID=3032 RepID=A0A7S0EYA4_9CRYP|mmetsp:Transcript_34297/g.77255  ORF Transcript_34297/g.77255 Transcript_34297/m.77255 type:complete len:115 (+) Transcript_34297:207-551(+)